MPATLEQKLEGQMHQKEKKTVLHYLFPIPTAAQLSTK
jgi:hypothetical protein